MKQYYADKENKVALIQKAGLLIKNKKAKTKNKKTKSNKMVDFFAGLRTVTVNDTDVY